MPPLWIIWSIMGILFLVAEALTVGFFLGWFGVAAIITAVLSAVRVPFGFQVGIFIVLSVIGIVLSRKFAEKITKEPPQKAAADRLIGMKGVVTVTIDSAKGIGRITVDRDSWLADSSDDTIIEKDEYVKVLEVSGTHLIVDLYKD